MKKKYPFKFLDAYTREDSDFFFGRNEEIEAMYEMVFQTDLLLVYGASGTGKTSLIQCGLAGKFQSHDWLALNIRRGKDLNASFEKALEDAGGKDGADSPQPDTEDLDWLDEDWTGNDPNPAIAKNLSPLARRFKAIYLKHFKPIYLIFDQFEELYILGAKSEQERFVQTIREVLLVEQPVKIIISIREEYLGYLYEFERAVPELLRKKLRVEPMNLDKVKTVIKSVGIQEQSIVHLQAGEEEAIAGGIFEKIRGEEKTLTIQLPYLQVFLDKLYLQTTKDEKRQTEAVFTMAELEKIGDIGDVLRDFLDEQVLRTARELQQKPENIWRILSPFVTLDGTKEPLSEEELFSRLAPLDTALIRSTLQAFVNSRILRYTEDKQLYEIAHDSLAKQIHAKRSDEEIAILEVQRLIKSQVALQENAREFFTEKQLLFIEPYLDKFKPGKAEQEWIARSRAHVQTEKDAAEKREAAELEKAQQQAEQERKLREKAQANEQRSRQRTRLAIFISLLALGIAFWAFMLNNKAQELTRKTNEQKVEIQQNLDDLGQKEADLQISLKTAKAARDTADVKRIEADLASTKAKRQEQLARTERDKAKTALANLGLANSSTALLLIENADRDILKLDYEAALQKIKAAASLGARKPEVAKALLEIAFWHGETGNAQRATALLDSAAALVNKTVNTQQSFRETLKAFDPPVYQKLMERYYPVLVKVEGGTFDMGCDPGDSCEDLHRQEVSSFQMAKYETTWWQYYLFCQATGHEYKSPGWGTDGDNPAVNVSWYDAVLYLNWVSRQFELDTFYLVENKRKGSYGDEYDIAIDTTAKKGYRLPTEAEWEFATKGGNAFSKTRYSGGNELDSVAWYSGNSGSRSQRVGGLRANELGLYDMSGNVYEWCWDWKDEYPTEQEKDYRGPLNGSYRVIRGGSWSRNAGYCRAAHRDSGNPDYRGSSIGFRLVFVP